MPLEIERKFLVAGDGWREAAEAGVWLRQGYLAITGRTMVRVRIGGGTASLTVKTPRRGLTRDEYSYPIPLDDAEAMLTRQCAGRVLTKTRHHVPFAGMLWHVDVYEGVAAGLVIAEIELEREDQAFAIPPWLGEEVSRKVRYKNSSIAGWRASPAGRVEDSGEALASAPQ